jgi:multiple sugar transport system permease protein
VKKAFGWLPTSSYYVLTAGLAIIFLAPLVWTVIASVSPQAGSAQTDGWGFGNYETLANYQLGIGTYTWNSVVITVLTVLFTLVISLFGGYAFARFVFPGKNMLFLLTLSILMVPYATLLIPLMVSLKAMGLNNTLVGVALVLAMFQLPFATFMMRISFESVPKELEESALMDGCGTFGALFRILLPAVKPGLMVPLYLLGSDNQPLPLALVNMRQQVMGVIDYGATQAGVTVLAIPCVVLFLVLQRQYVAGFMSGALKG